MNRKRITHLIALPAVMLPLAGVAAAASSRTAYTASSPAAQVRAAERDLSGPWVRTTPTPLAACSRPTSS